MKKLIVPLAMVFVFWSTSAYSTMGELAVTFGAMSWYNRYVPISRIGGMDVPKSSYGFMNGPVITARYRDWILDATYLLSSNNYDRMITNSPIKIHHAVANSSAARSDVDVVVSYLLTPVLSLNVGYKGIFVDDTVTLLSNGVTNNAKRYEYYNMGTLGIGVNIPLGTKLIWTLNSSALLGEHDIDVSYPAYYNRLNEPSDNTTAWGISSDTSLACSIIKDLSANIGLKYQYIKVGSDNSNFFGPTLRLEYRF